MQKSSFAIVLAAETAIWQTSSKHRLLRLHDIPLSTKTNLSPRKQALASKQIEQTGPDPTA